MDSKITKTCDNEEDSIFFTSPSSVDINNATVQEPTTSNREMSQDLGGKEKSHEATFNDQLLATLLETKDEEGLFQILNLCYSSIRDNAIQIHGERRTRGGIDFFKSIYGEIAFSEIEKGHIFKIISEDSRKVIISGIDLRVHECLAASIACFQSRENLANDIKKMNIERAIVLLTDMVNLMTIEDLVYTNFLSFLQKMTKTTFEKKDAVYMAYHQVFKLPKDILPWFTSEDKTLGFSVYNGGMRLLGLHIGGRKLGTSHTLLLAQLVSASGVPAPVTINKKANNWKITFKSPGDIGYSSSMIESLLTFLDVQKTNPGRVIIEGWCANGSTAVIGNFIKTHPGAAVKFINYSRFSLASQADINSWIYLTINHHIDIQRIVAVSCAATCDLPIIPLLVPLMLKVKMFTVAAQQKDDFWRIMSEAMGTKEHNVSWLGLAGFKTTYDNIKLIAQIIRQIGWVSLIQMDISKTHLDHLASTLNMDSKFNINSKKICKLVFHEVKTSSHNIEKIIACVGSVETVQLKNMKLSEQDWEMMGEGFVKVASKGNLKLKSLQILGSTAKPGTTIAMKIKDIGVNITS